MIFINKNQPPDSFNEWCSQSNENWMPTFSTLQNPEKLHLLQALVEEQCNICCYCNRSIEALVCPGETRCHIEHFRPRSGWSDLQLNYDNLHASCGRDNNLGASRTCGHAKGDWFDEDNIVSPLDIGCLDEFIFHETGSVEGSTPRGSATIEKLNLNDKLLQEGRKRAIEQIFPDELSHEDLTNLLDGLNQPDYQGKLLPYTGSLVSVAKQLLLISA